MIQGAAEGLGFEGYVTSPSFVIVNEYEGNVPIVHADLYRIADPRELEDIGLREIYFSEGVSFVEWVDRAPEFLPENRISVVIEIVGEEGREMTFTAFGDAGREALARLRETWEDASAC
jgi:tRNA threonylcarbamoyladenosine biosynthesis protein TsaE